MKLEEGMYVRIEDDSRIICIGIGKIQKIVSETIYVNMNFNLPISFKEKQIKKSSYELIDLIEVGDYVNGELVEYIEVDSYKDYVINSGYWCKQENIKSIVTKEQFEAMKYEIS